MTLCRDMCDLPGDFGLTAIDDLPEMMRVFEGIRGYLIFL